MSDNRPNILLITTDQQRFDTILPWRPSWLRTPHLDHLQRTGINFTKAYADIPLCVPSRMAVLTGKYGRNHKMLHNGSTSQLIGSENTIATCLNNLDYQTCCVGKMHFSPQRARHGFQESWIPEDYFQQMRKSGNPLQSHRHGIGANEFYPGMSTVPEAMTLTSWIAETSSEYIRERRDPTKPFFLWTSFSKPHPPFDPPEPYYSMYRNSPIPEPVYGNWSDDENCPAAIKRHRKMWCTDLIAPEVIMEARAAYYGLITQIDYNIGRIYSALLENGLLDNTLIIFTSDHGEYLGDFHSSSKIFFHEVAAHIPFIMRMPKTWNERFNFVENDSLVTIADIFPTIISAAGSSPPKDCNGMDLISLVHGKIPARSYIDGSAGEGIDDPRAHLAITDGRWKYLWFPEGACEQFFDVKADPQEERNLAGQQDCAEQQKRLKQELIRRYQDYPDMGFVEDGHLVVKSLINESDAELRNKDWQGWYFENAGRDVRH